MFKNFKCKRWHSTYIYTYIVHKTPVIWHLGKNLSCTWTKMKTMENVISIKYFLPHQLQQHIKLEGNALPFYPEFFYRWINICSPLYTCKKNTHCWTLLQPTLSQEKTRFQKCQNETSRRFKLNYGEMLNIDIKCDMYKSAWRILTF